MNAPLPNRRGTGAIKWDLAREEEIPLWVADMDFPVAPEITDALHRRIEHPIFGYSLVPQDYHDAFLAWQRERNGWDIDPEHLVVVPSVMQALAVAIETYTQSGDTIGVFSPVYYPFYDAVEELDRRILRIPLAIAAPGNGGAPEDGDATRGDAPRDDYSPRYVFDLEYLREHVGELSLLLLCSPHNPGGRVWTAEELTAVRKITETAGVRVVSDEIHSDLIFPGERFVPWLSASVTATATEGGGSGGNGSVGAGDIALLAPSKTFNIPGLPTAWAVIADTDTRERYTAALHARMHKLTNLLTVEAATAAYRHSGAWLDALRPRLAHNFGIVKATLRGLGGR
jgi:cystathionine beta-lyase